MAESPCAGRSARAQRFFFLTIVALLLVSGLAPADEIARVKHPFLEWYGLWPGRTAIGADGQTWTQDKPEGVRLAVQLARKSRIFHPTRETVGTEFGEPDHGDRPRGQNQALVPCRRRRRERRDVRCVRRE